VAQERDAGGVVSRFVSPDGRIDLRLGRWQEALADVDRCDALICDPPYSARTHEGAASNVKNGSKKIGVSGYAAWSAEDVQEFAFRWMQACAGWVVVHTDHETHADLEQLAQLGLRMTFPPVPVLQQMPRLQGDGPGSPGHFLMVARPRERRFIGWGSLPCWYEAERDASIVFGGKPLGLMRAIVRDYSRPGDLVVDPFCGGGTTALACAIEGRRCITSEMDPKTFELARKRLSAGYMRDMFSGQTP